MFMSRQKWPKCGDSLALDWVSSNGEVRASVEQLSVPWAALKTHSKKKHALPLLVSSFASMSVPAGLLPLPVV